LSDAPAIIRTVEHAEPSVIKDLPETKWLWRRVFVFSCTLACALIIAWIVRKTTDIQTLRTIAVNSQYLVALFAILYMTGSGIEGVVALVTAFRSTRKETITSAPPPVSVTTPGATVQTASPGPAGAHGPDPTQFGGPRP
jgi:hypothetical protein